MDRCRLINGMVSVYKNIRMGILGVMGYTNPLLDRKGLRSNSGVSRPCPFTHAEHSGAGGGV